MTENPIIHIKSLIQKEAEETDQLIVSSLSSDVALINQISQYIIHSGGKRLRPLLVLLSGKALSAPADKLPTAAAIIEFIHTATLLHDDVVDESSLRRGKETANAHWGNGVSVLTGDFLYSRAFQMMVSLNNMRVMDILAEATNRISEGEVQQLINCNNPETTETDYFETIYNKTAKLFEAGCQIGAILADAPEQHEKAILNYGKHLGTAFQLADDILDYTASADEMGKNLGDDLAEGKPTLPLIYALANCNDSDAKLISTSIEEGTLKNLDAILTIINDCHALDYARDCAKKEVALAIERLAPLPDSIYKEALIELAQFSLNRRQ